MLEYCLTSEVHSEVAFLLFFGVGTLAGSFYVFQGLFKGGS